MPGLFVIFDAIKESRKIFLRLNNDFIFLQLVVSIHLIIFMARTRGHFWSIKPGSALLWSAVTTKLLATLMVAYGLFVPAIGWYYAGIVLGYCLVSFVITDFIKVPPFQEMGVSRIK